MERAESLGRGFKQLPNVDGVIVGDALFTEADQQYRSELVALAETLGSNQSGAICWVSN